MKIFWPNRAKVKGFLIENLPRKYSERISSVPPSKILDKVYDDINFKSDKEVKNLNVIYHYSVIRGHWANRDFSEYKDAA